MFGKWFEILKLCNGRSTISDIAKSLGMRIGTVSEYLDDMQRLGLVELITIPEPPRRIVCRRTSLGECIARCFENLDKETALPR